MHNGLLFASRLYNRGYPINFEDRYVDRKFYTKRYFKIDQHLARHFK